MSDISTNNKRIAKNTMMLYLRMFVSMSVSLYTSRVVLNTLGIEDYGICNVVGGVIGMFSFINSTMSTATSRFLTFELGSGNISKLKDTFNSSFWVHVIIAAIIFILSETIGLWFFYNKMVIPEERIYAAQVVFQLSIISTIVSITQVPYNAVLIAHEKMDIYAYVEMINVFLKLLILYILVVSKFDKLILYGILSTSISIGIAMIYRIYGKNKFQECRIQRKLNIDIIKPMLSFSGWDFYGNMSVTARTQGVAMLLNMFFGPVINAAAGIAASVQGAVMGFANNVTVAVRPQIIKYYSQSDYSSMNKLIFNACRINFLIMLLIMTPLCGEIDYILHLWLGNVPDSAAIFCILILCFNLFAELSFIVVTGIHATGKIIRPSLINGSLYLLVVPISYIAFKLGLPAWISYLINFLAVIIGLLSNAYTLHLYVNDFSFISFVKSVIAKCVFLLIIALLSVLPTTLLMEASFLRLIITTISTSLFIGCIGWFLMIPLGVRKQIFDKIKQISCKKD